MCGSEMQQYRASYDSDGDPIMIWATSKCGETSVRGTRLICEACENDPVVMQGIRALREDAAADNQWLASSGWGEM